MVFRKGSCLRESSSRPERHLLQSSARVSNERNVWHARCAVQEQCREIHCRVEQVGALRDLGVRHAMERLCESRGQSNEKGLDVRRAALAGARCCTRWAEE